MDKRELNRFIHPAVVLGLGAGGLDAARSLGKQGIKVYGIFTKEDEPGRFSRYSNSLCFPPIKSDSHLFSERLIGFAKDIQKKTVLIPTTDEAVNFISNYREMLAEYFFFQIPDGDVIENFLNKACMVQLANKHGLETPSTFFCKDIDSIHHIAEVINYPCIIKPLNSFSIFFQSKNIIIKDKQSFIDVFKTHTEYIENSLVQEFIKGDDNLICQFNAYFDNESRPLSIITIKKNRQYPPNRGIGSYVTTEELPQLRALSLSFLKSINYKGIASLEFKMNPKTGQYFFIEINPRIPWYHRICSDSCNSLVLTAYLDLTGGNIKKDPIIHQINGVRWIDFGRDMGSFIRKFLGNKITFHAWIVSVFKANSFAYWDSKDTRPFFYVTWRFFISSIKAFLRFFRTGKILS